MQTLRLNNIAGVNDTDIYMMIDRIGPINKNSTGNHTVMEIRDGKSTPPMLPIGAQDQIAGGSFGNQYTSTSSNYSITGQLHLVKGDLIFLKSFAMTNSLDLYVLGDNSLNNDGSGAMAPIRIAGVLIPPATLTFGTTTTTSIVINWTSGDSDGTGYILQRATNSGFTTGLTTIYTGSNLTFTDTGLTTGTTYYYRIVSTAINFNNSGYRTANHTTN